MAFPEIITRLGSYYTVSCLEAAGLPMLRGSEGRKEATMLITGGEAKPRK
jgi:hypothetical protein